MKIIEKIRPATRRGKESKKNKEGIREANDFVVARWTSNMRRVMKDKTSCSQLRFNQLTVLSSL